MKTEGFNGSSPQSSVRMSKHAEDLLSIKMVNICPALTYN